MEERQEVLSRLNYNHMYREKIREEFCFNLPNNEKADLVYSALLEERKLYFCYAVAVSALSQAFWDFNDSTRRVAHLIIEWEKCTLELNNYHSFIQLMDDFIQKEVNKELITKWYTNFSLLFKDPEKIEKGMRNEMLLFLCRINASHSLRLFLKLHYPAVEINFSSLLKEAVGCLHSQSVQALVESGANIRDYFCTGLYQDDGVYVFMPPLYYAVWSPNDHRCVLNRDKPQIRWHNPKLKNIIETLLSLGADPLQNCLIAPWPRGEFIPDPSVKDKTETKENVITLVRNIIADQSSDTKLDEASLTFLSYVAELKPKIDLNAQEEQTEQNTSLKYF
ncbi:hypothetical protein FOLKNPGA_02503 [Legionella sp. PC1000]|uniref:hypothetical protein n=1 Tax=Legionella sp. PC1000 TaxID=2746060 RepID=UPI0015FE773E|nr:hypothetical protein [Legionella sp. PC1000]QLZ69705.1 hypothetical protein FOLKNPGA_02503 [Legionella sp. PC1000]